MALGDSSPTNALHAAASTVRQHLRSISVNARTRT